VSQVEQYQCLVAKIGMGRMAVVSVVMREMRVEREEKAANLLRHIQFHHRKRRFTILYRERAARRKRERAVVDMLGRRDELGNLGVALRERMKVETVTQLAELKETLEELRDLELSFMCDVESIGWGCQGQDVGEACRRLMEVEEDACWAALVGDFLFCWFWLLGP
jgi:D-alanyl-D-alanine carboxypeptidase